MPNIPLRNGGPKARIAVIPGDGIGREVTPVAVQVIRAATAKRNRPLEFVEFDWGADKYLRENVSLPEGAVEMLRDEFDAILFGALGDPRVSYANLSQRITAHTDPGKHWLVGSTMPRNEATRRARGRWLLHFDDDDHLRPDAVASLLEVVRIERAEVAYGGFEAHYPDRERVTCMSFPPRPGYFSWAGALMHGGLRFFERELFAAQLELPGDVYMLERMLRAGVRFAMLEEVLLDYFPSTHWEQTEPPPG